ncbi:MAG: hypothetical protein AAF086_06330 [Planctomycetota bacterium]
MNTSPLASAVVAATTYGLPFAGFIWFIGIAVREPWGWWYRVGEEAIAQLPCFFVPMALVAALIAGCTVVTRRSFVASAHTRCVFLASIFLFIPFMVWLSAAAFITLNADVMNDDRLDDLAGSLLINTLGSCFVPPVFGFMWMLTLGQGFVTLDELLQQNQINCRSCGYDLTGTRAAGIGRCPECGAGVEALADGDALESE